MANRNASVRVICHADFRRSIAAFRSSGRLIDTRTIPKLVETAALSAKKLAQVNLKEMVYTAQLPKSATHTFPNDPEMYLSRRRTGHIFRAIKTDPPYREGAAWVGTVKVDRADFTTFYYALILNYGGKTIKYDARPFWKNMRDVMVIRFRALGKATGAAIKVACEDGVSDGTIIIETAAASQV